jgi:hypothetical protein
VAAAVIAPTTVPIRHDFARLYEHLIGVGLLTMK